ncbi:MAG: co-chaperone DjlA [Legionellaceae bacterium]|nr:co-chaperone DjlA [Legionellaceae bacterium]
MIFRAQAHRYFFWGKLLGAGLGFLTAGPIGALFGVFAGNLFDRGLTEHLIKTNNYYRIEKNPAIKKAFLHATFASLGHIAKADGRVSEEEIQLTKLMMKELHLNKSEETAAKQYFQQGKHASYRITEPLALLQNLAQKNPKLLHAFVQLQYRMAQVDGLSPEKVTTLNILLNKLGLASLHKQAHARNDYRAQFNQNDKNRSGQTGQTHQEYYASQDFYTSQTLDSSYQLLGLSSSATKQDVKRAYRRLISKHHPDKCIAAGMSKQRIKAANEKTQAIRKAYEHICEVKGS